MSGMQGKKAGKRQALFQSLGYSPAAIMPTQSMFVSSPRASPNLSSPSPRNNRSFPSASASPSLLSKQSMQSMQSTESGNLASPRLMRPLSPTSANEVTDFYEAFRTTPKDEQRRPFSTSSRQSARSHDSRTTHGEDVHSLFRSLNHRPPEVIQAERASLRRRSSQNSRGKSNKNGSPVSPWEVEEPHKLQSLTTAQVNQIYRPTDPLYSMPHDLLMRDLTEEEVATIYGPVGSASPIPPRNRERFSRSGFTRKRMSVEGRPDDWKHYEPIQEDEGVIINCNHGGLGLLSGLGISGEIQIYNDIRNDAVKEETRAPNMEEGDGEGLRESESNYNNATELVREKDESPEMFDQEFQDLFDSGSSDSNTFYEQDQEDDFRGTQRLDKELQDVHFSSSLRSDSMYSQTDRGYEQHQEDDSWGEGRLDKQLQDLQISPSLRSNSACSQVDREEHLYGHSKSNRNISRYPRTGEEELVNRCRADHLDSYNTEIIHDTSTHSITLGGGGGDRIDQENPQLYHDLAKFPDQSPLEYEEEAGPKIELSEEEDTGVEEGQQRGLGINFYDHRDHSGAVIGDGNGDVVVEAQQVGSKRGLRSDSVGEAEADEAQTPARPTPLRFPSNTNINPETPQSPSKFDYEPFVKPGESPESLINDLLEDNYRGQAESFSRKTSLDNSSSARSVSASIPSPHSDHPTPLFFRTFPFRSASSPTGTLYTPTRQTNKSESFASIQRRLPRTPSDNSIIKSYKVRRSNTTGTKGKGLLGEDLHTSLEAPPPLQYESHPFRPRSSSTTRHKLYYFTEEERQKIEESVLANRRDCHKNHENCLNCLDEEYAYYENKIMSTSMPPEERQKIINNNRSLRNIKNELESLAEHGAISDEAYNTIMRVLPAESSLNGPSRSAAVSPAPVPTAALNNLNLSRNDPPPPAYNNPTPPALPGRQASALPSRPEIARATALYRYSAEGDCNFEVGDQISVFEYMNNEWWFGKNTRTGQEGVFPVNYVQKQAASPQPQHGFYGNEKAGGFGGGYPAQAAQAQQGPPPPGPSNPYNSAVPPMAMANGSDQSGGDHKPNKGQEMGKKFGKKLGNAAIFGAGATIGGNIVNSIF